MLRPSPAFWPRTLFCCSLLLAVGSQSLIPNGLFFDDLKNFVHFPVFALLAGWSLWEWQRRRPLSLAAGVLVVTLLVCAGGLIELLQPYVQRSQSWEDFIYNCAGIATGALLFLAWQKRPPFAVSGALCISLLAALPLLPGARAWWLQQQQFPVIMDFEQPQLYSLLHWSDPPTPAIQRAPSTWTDNRSQVGVLALTGEQWAGLGLLNFPPDWRAYDRLELEIFSPHPFEIPVNLRVVDRQHNWEFEDRFNLHTRLQPGNNLIRVALHQVEQAPRTRQLQLSQVKELLIFARPREDGARLYIDNIRLSPAPGDR